ncbi:hypothetical protein [Microbulbifer taiwanensis]|uniref:DUF2934 domain-containing protein n=1 Tax=Microbulbifer taiwanensis TaxID=986746 RepID=A0ABW1YG54_9GAMM|nr:hypothetical protein [Microbulbifer taiwanensis]
MKQHRPKPGTKEFDDWLLERAEARSKELFKNGPADFDERGAISGSEESLTSTDAEAFPDELEEYRPEERKPRLVPKKKKD